jgi:hypothetical protein
MSRIKNWDKNFNAESAGEMQMRLKPMMKERLEAVFKIQEMLENKVKKIMGESGLPTWHNIPYLNFGRQVYKARRRYVGRMRTREIALLMKLAQMKQLQKPLLIKIRRAIAKLPIID